jgi:hypothetical protein
VAPPAHPTKAALRSPLAIDRQYLGTGSRPGAIAYSCTDLEVVTIDPSCAAQQVSEPPCQTGYDLVNPDPANEKCGKVWLLPYNTNKDPASSYPVAYTWYDELLISRNRIADPL